MVGAAVVRTEALRGGGCCRSPETVREQAVCFLVEGDGLRRGGGLLFWGEAGFERRLCGAVVAAVPRKRSGNRRCVSWSKGTGCGGAAGFSFGERPGSNGGSAGRWLLPFPGNGPGTGGVFLGRRGRAAAGRRASFSGRGGFGHVSRRHRYSLLSPAACVSAPRRLPPRCLSSSHHPLLPAPPPLLTRRTSCQPPRRLCPRRLCPRRLLPPPPLLATPVAVCLPAACRFSSPVITRRLPPATSATAACHPCRCLPPRCLSLFPACYHPPPAARYLRRCLRPRFCLPSRRFSPAAPAACHFRRHAPAGRTDGLRRHPAWSVGARCVAGEKFCEIIWKIGKSFLSLFRLSIGVLAFRGRDSCFLLDYHSYGKRDYLSDGGRVQEAQGRA